MVILDTHVVSEPAKSHPSPAVMAWLAAQPDESQFVTSVTLAEIFLRVERLPAGRRRDQLRALAVRLLEEAFQGRILPFHDAAARQYPAVILARQSLGRPISQFDAMIAAIARAANAPVATRNAADFEGCGVRIVDPWRYDKE